MRPRAGAGEDAGHPDFVAMTCRKCGATTGFGMDVEAIREHWERGDLALPYDLMEDE